MNCLASPDTRWLASVDITVDVDGNIVPVVTDCRHTLLQGGMEVFGNTLASHLEDAAQRMRDEVVDLKSADARGLVRKD